MNALLRLLGVTLVGTALLAISHTSDVVAEECVCDATEVGYTFQTDDSGNLVLDKDGLPILTEDKVGGPPDAPAVRRRRSDPPGNIDAPQECETDSSSPDGRRTSCRSGGFAFRCPSGYYLVKLPTNEEHLHKESERGSENHWWIDWTRYVEIYPDTGVMVPTNVTFQVGARSNRGANGDPGKTKGRFKCEVRRLPRS